LKRETPLEGGDCRYSQIPGIIYQITNALFPEHISGILIVRTPLLPKSGLRFKQKINKHLKTDIMKQIKNAGILMILVASMISFQSNAQNTDKILKDPEKREQIMTAIGNNSEMRMEMMEKMMKMVEKDTTMSKMMKEKMATMKKEKGLKCECECKKEDGTCQCKMDEDENKDKG